MFSKKLTKSVSIGVVVELLKILQPRSLLAQKKLLFVVELKNDLYKNLTNDLVNELWIEHENEIMDELNVILTNELGRELNELDAAIGIELDFKYFNNINFYNIAKLNNVKIME